jgi:NMD protein affecting ribosome stability and mRNA decay
MMSPPIPKVEDLGGWLQDRTVTKAPGTYTVPGYCGNCGHRQTLTIPKGDHVKLVTCKRCECKAVDRERWFDEPTLWKAFTYRLAKARKIR